jgi:hypothetical protein
MATSGVTTWQMTSNEIIDAALRKIAAISSGVSATSANRTDALQALNAMLKTFQTKGMPLWAIKEHSFALTATRSYAIGAGQTVATPAPLKVVQAYIKHTTDLTSVPLLINNRNDYNTNQPASTTTGVPVELEYIIPGQTQIGTIRIWPLPDSDTITNKQITLVYQRPFEDMVNTTDNVDFPQFWHEAIIYGLAVRIAPEFGVPIKDRTILKAEAKEFLDDALSFGTEEGSIFVMPDYTRR